MNDYRVSLKIRNNRILKAIEEVGGKPGAKWCEDNGLSYTMVNDLINMTSSPLDQNGDMRNIALTLCDVLNKIPDDLWSGKQLYPLEKNFSEMEMSIDQVMALLPTHETTYIQDFTKAETSRLIKESLDSLLDNEKRVMEMIFFNDMTLEEVGREIGVSRERVRQIEAKSLRKLRNPKLSDVLRNC